MAILVMFLYFNNNFMKKQDFIKAVANKALISQDAVSKVLGSMIEVIVSELKAWNEVNITWFGSYRVSTRAARNWVNPRTWAAMKIASMKSPVFRAGKTLKEAIRG